MKTTTPQNEVRTTQPLTLEDGTMTTLTRSLLILAVAVALAAVGAFDPHDPEPVVLNPSEEPASIEECQYCGHLPCACGG